MTIDFSGKSVIVTGASQGLGECIAREFAKSNASVAIIYRSQQEKAEKLEKELQKKGAKAIAIQCDVSNSDEVKNMTDKVLQKFGSVDILVNNAAVNPKKPEGKTPVYEISNEEWDLVLSVNLKGAFYCTREALKIMLKQGNGSIVNISSLSGVIGNGAPVGAPYCVSKAGMICLTKSTALDVADKGIRVNTVAPGPIEGPTNLRNKPEVNALMASKIPIKRISKQEEVAAGVLFLASDISGSITGQTLHINGGWHMP